MRDILLTAIVFGSIPFIFYRPHLGILVWAWLSYMTPYRYTWFFAYDFRFAFLIAAVTLCAWVLSREPKRIPWSIPVVLLLAFWAWTGLTTSLAHFPSAAEHEWQDITKKILMNGVVTAALIGSRARINALVWVIVLSIGFFGIKGGLFTLATGGAYRVSGAPDSYFGENNFLAAVLIITIPLLRYLQLNSKQRILRWGLTGAMVLCVISALGSQSRGAFLGLIALCLFMLVRSRKRLLVSFGLVAVLSWGVVFMPQQWHDRMATIITYEDDGSAQGRLKAWEFALEVLDQRPWTGMGYEAFRANQKTAGRGYTSAHSIFFQVLGEHGVVGFALYVLTGLFTFLCGNRIIRHSKGHEDLKWAQDLARMIQVSLLSFACVGAFLNVTYFELLFHFVAIMVVTNTVVQQRLTSLTRVVDWPADYRQRGGRHEPATGTPVLGEDGWSVGGRDAGTRLRD